MNVYEIVTQGFEKWTQVRTLSNGDQVIRLPFWSGGDPIELGVECAENQIVLTDGGNVAGMLFSLDQHKEGSAGFEMVLNMAESHDLDVDFEEGLITMESSESTLYDDVSEMAKIVMTLLTAVPHLTSTPNHDSIDVN